VTRLKVLLLAIFTALAVISFWSWLNQPNSPSMSVSGMEAGPRGADRAGIYRGPPNSVAVIAFAGLEDGESPPHLLRGFARGVSERLMAHGGLEVTAPASSLYFSTGAGDLDSVSQRLHAASLVSGRLALEGDSIVVAVELHDMKKGRSVFAETYRAGRDGITALERDIAQAVADRIPARKLPVPALPAMAAGAWLEASEARWQLEQGRTEEAAALFRSALERVPGDVRARLGLAESLLASLPPRPGEAERLVDAVLEDAPGSARALGLKSHIERRFHWNPAAAAAAAGRAIDEAPGDASLLYIGGRASAVNGRYDEAVERIAAAARLDPVNLNTRFGLGLAQEFAGDDEGALTTYRVVLNLNPDYPGAHAARARIKILQDNPDSALRESEEESDGFWRQYARALAFAALGDEGEMEAAMQEMSRLAGAGAAFQLAEVLVVAGRQEAALGQLEAALAQRDSAMLELPGNRLLEPLYGHPRWQMLITAVGLPLDGNDTSD
jgi:TolB-like protein/thioredoxin-like negative regulator of GroEL